MLEFGDNPKAGIYIANSRVGALHIARLCTKHCVAASLHVAEGAEILLVSAYFQYAEPIEPHILEVDRVLDHLQGKSAVIGVDANAHSPIWFSHQRHYTGRGQDAVNIRTQTEDFINGRGLIIGNREGQPYTFSGPNGDSNIDLTLTTRGAVVSDWKVHSDISQ
ncbi:unnamed protein product, partial [Iphiclides podalirius]